MRKLKSTRVVMAGLVVILAGFVVGVATAKTVVVADPQCWPWGPPYTGQWICNDHQNETFWAPPYVNETIYPYFVPGIIIVVAGLATLGYGIGLPEKQHEGWPG
jgi:hypothetical protein